MTVVCLLYGAMTVVCLLYGATTVVSLLYSALQSDTAEDHYRTIVFDSKSTQI